MNMQEAIDLTVESLCEYGRRYQYWSVAYSGGKDSSATLTVLLHLIKTGRVPPPKKLFVLYADTRLELLPLQASATGVLQAAQGYGAKTYTVLPPMDKRLLVNILGRGVPPPSIKFRWCTEALKVKPMNERLVQLSDQLGEKFLVITGVRLGESALRDEKIHASCTRDGGECGQGWFQQMQSTAIADTLSPLLHWRVCHVWDWLMFFAPDLGFPTVDIADAYGGDEALEDGNRTGCVGCNLVEEDRALEAILKLAHWRYLEPLRRIRELWRWLKEPQNRLRHEGRVKKDGTPAHREGKLGAISLDAREEGLRVVLGIQREVNARARAEGRPLLSLINDAENRRIRRLLKARTYPQGWHGEEPRGDVLVNIERERALTAADSARGLLDVLKPGDLGN